MRSLDLFRCQWTCRDVSLNDLWTCRDDSVSFGPVEMSVDLSDVSLIFGPVKMSVDLWRCFSVKMSV